MLPAMSEIKHGRLVAIANKLSTLMNKYSNPPTAAGLQQIRIIEEKLADLNYDVCGELDDADETICDNLRDVAKKEIKRQEEFFKVHGEWS